MQNVAQITSEIGLNQIRS